MDNDLDKLNNYFLQIVDILDKVDDILMDINQSEFPEKGLELVGTFNQFSKSLHEIFMKYGPIMDEYETEYMIVPYRFPRLKEAV